MNEDQEKLLEDCKKDAKEQAYFMRKALENADLRKGLKFAAEMLAQLKTSLLLPRNYYILFMSIFDYMRELEKYFKEDFRRGRKMIDVYEAVQHAPGLIPRLYLLITVGSVYIQSHEEGSEKILDDLIEMMKAVQNPLRGLFLRYYFLKMCKDRLPDTGSEYETDSKGVVQAIDTIHINLTESTHLWMRIGGQKDKAKRIKEREDLKILIGENLMRISSLEGVNVKIYKEQVLPKMIALLKESKDAMTQQYLLDCMIQGFPEEFHINTLSELLETCSKELEKDVDMKLIFIALMERLSNYLSDNSQVIENIEINIYELFQTNIQELVRNSQSSQVKSTLNLYSAFMQFTLKCYPSQHEYVNEILKEAAQYCSQNEKNIDDDCQEYISKFLIHPLETLAHVILTMKEYPTLMKYLKFKKRRNVAKNITKAVSRGQIYLSDTNVVEQLIVFIKPVLVKEPDYEDISELMFKEEQILVSKIVWQIKNEEIGTSWEILKAFIDQFVQGGEERMRYTLPSAIFRILALMIQASKENPEPKNYKKLINQTKNLIEKITPIDHVLGIKLYLEFLLTISHVDSETKFYDEATNEIAVQCLETYESQVTDSNTRQIVLGLIINAFTRLNCVSEENYDTLASNIISYCSKILKKNEQVQVLLSCCFLFANAQADPKRIHEILKRCAKTTKTVVNTSLTHLNLFFLILDSYVFFVRQKQIIEDPNDDISSIVQLVESKLEEPQEGEENIAAQNSYKQKWAEISHLYK